MNKPGLALLCGCLLGTVVLPKLALAQDQQPCFPMNPTAGCYVLATPKFTSLPPGPLFWHLYTVDAATKADSMSTVVQAHGKTWLFRIAPADWKPSSGERVAVIGPLVLPSGAKEYAARYMVDVAPILPGDHTTPVHHHPGTEAWYVLAGAQCLRAPGKTLVVHAGESAFMPPGLPMTLSQSGNETRRSLILVLHDAAKPWAERTDEWKPTSEVCPGS